MSRKTKPYRPWNPAEPFLLPPSPRDWLPEGHLAFFIIDVIDLLDLSALEAEVQAKDPRGTRPYDPSMMVALLLYAYCTGVYSSRRIERGTYENIAFRVIAGQHHPSFGRIAAFRREHLATLAGLFSEALRLCREAGLVKLGHVSVDGTKIKANASKHSAMSYDRMQADEQRLCNEIDALMKQAEETDAQEDAKYGNKSGDELPEELQRRTTRLERIRTAKAALEEKARQARAEKLEEQARTAEAKADATEDPAERRRALRRAGARRSAASAILDDNPDPSTGSGGSTSEGGDAPPAAPEPTPSPSTTTSGASPEADTAQAEVESDLPDHHVPTTVEGLPKPKAQRNFTDPDSRIMKSDGAYIQAYNAQIVVDAEERVIVAEGVGNQAPDTEYLAPMLQRVEENVGVPDKVTGDAGYYSAANVEMCEARGIDPYLSPRRQKHGEAQEIEPQGEPPPDDTGARERMRAKLATKEGHAVYALRKTLPEPVFGHIKEARRFRRFSMRGLTKVRHEWSLVCASHNLLALHRAVREGRASLRAS